MKTIKLQIKKSLYSAKSTYNRISIFTFLGMLLIIVTLFSCSKGNNNRYPSLGTLSVDIDGVPTSFTNCKANISGTDSNGNLSIVAETADSSSNLTIFLTNYHAPIRPDTYIDSSYPSSTQLTFYYNQQQAPHDNQYFYYSSRDTLDVHTNITITAIDSVTTSIILDSVQYPVTYPSALQGTFNAKVAYSVLNSNIPIQHALTHTLTNGKFNLPNLW
jgi:uncharacterized protein involved in outer membrane biogenesis